jgi:hypothetical protein
MGLSYVFFAVVHLSSTASPAREAKVQGGLSVSIRASQIGPAVREVRIDVASYQTTCSLLQWLSSQGFLLMCHQRSPRGPKAAFQR